MQEGFSSFRLHLKPLDKCYRSFNNEKTFDIRYEYQRFSAAFRIRKQVYFCTYYIKYKKFRTFMMLF